MLSDKIHQTPAFIMRARKAVRKAWRAVRDSAIIEAIARVASIVAVVASTYFALLML